MDFGTLLHKAQKNDQSGKKEIRYYSTKFEPPKKEQRNKTLSANIQKFLARKEEEERRKNEEAKKKMDQLLELRSKDKRATRRVNVMLKRTKSANQSVIQDAVDNDNTAVTLAGPSQPDEDDYGYVSQSAADYYNKIMEKYSKMPDEPKFDLTKKKVSTNLTSTKERVKAALDREAEEAMQPHRRKRKHKDTSGDGGSKESEEQEEKYDKYEPKKEEKPAKPKLKPAPVINFSELLKIAEKKQFEPILVEQKKEKEEERLLTKRQRREMEREKESRERRELREQQGISGTSSPSQNPVKSIKIPKLNAKPESENRSPKPEFKVPKMNGLNERVPKKQVDERPYVKPPTPSVKPPVPNGKPPMQNGRPPMSNGKPPMSSGKPPMSNGKPPTSNSKPAPMQRPVERKPERPLERVKDMKTRPLPQGKPSQPARDPKAGKQEVRMKPREEIKPKQFPPPDLKPKQFPPADMKPKQFPPRDMKPKQFPPPDMRRPGGMKKGPIVSKGRILDDEDEDYDSEMDDFIDDGPEEEDNDYSKYISEIFGYDKRKYSHVDDDVDDMETSFAGQMREECISTKIGIMEDLEDMKQEEAAKRRKAIMKKKMKR